jgi:ADP-glucose pyrophosphorylase
MVNNTKYEITNLVVKLCCASNVNDILMLFTDLNEELKQHIQEVKRTAERSNEMILETIKKQHQDEIKQTKDKVKIRA